MKFYSFSLVSGSQIHYINLDNVTHIDMKSKPRGRVVIYFNNSSPLRLDVHPSDYQYHPDDESDGIRTTDLLAFLEVLNSHPQR